MIDWTIVADLGTAAGTALLAVATFASTRSANRSARSAERALLEGLRPILVPSQWQEPVQKIHFMDGVWLHVAGGRAATQVDEQAAYVVLSLHNAGQGLAVLHGWHFPDDLREDHAAVEHFYRLTRDIYIPANGLGFGQIAIRDPASRGFEVVSESVANSTPFVVDLLYGDAEASQRVITRFAFTPGPGESTGEGEWALSAGRHWNLDLPDPR